MKNQSAPMLDGGLSALIADLDERGLLGETLVVAIGEFGRSPNAASARPATATATTAAITGRTAIPPALPAPASNAACVYGKSTAPASAPWTIQCIRRNLLATIYHSSASIRTRSSTTTSTSRAKW